MHPVTSKSKEVAFEAHTFGVGDSGPYGGDVGGYGDFGVRSGHRY